MNILSKEEYTYVSIAGVPFWHANRQFSCTGFHTNSAPEKYMTAISSTAIYSLLKFFLMIVLDNILFVLSIKTNIKVIIHFKLR